MTISELLSRIIDDITEDAAALECSAEIEHCRTIVARGSSAEFQLRAYRESGDDIVAASRWIAAATMAETRMDAGRRTQVPS
ncbi:gamma-glutamyl:cysteine ligase YbdK (ATP-grasp superfamily) [Bradyrhizobium sp. GM24.11]